MKRLQYPGPQKVMTVREVSVYLRVHPTTIYRLLKKNQIPAFKIGSDWRFNIHSIDRWCLQKEKLGSWALFPLCESHGSQHAQRNNNGVRTYPGGHRDPGLRHLPCAGQQHRLARQRHRFQFDCRIPRGVRVTGDALAMRAKAPSRTRMAANNFLAGTSAT